MVSPFLITHNYSNDNNDNGNNENENNSAVKWTNRS